MSPSSWPVRPANSNRSSAAAHHPGDTLPRRSLSFLSLLLFCTISPCSSSTISVSSEFLRVTATSKISFSPTTPPPPPSPPPPPPPPLTRLSGGVHSRRTPLLRSAAPLEFRVEESTSIGRRGGEEEEAEGGGKGGEEEEEEEGGGRGDVGKCLFEVQLRMLPREENGRQRSNI